jgi:microcystin-dependent protein
MTEPYVGEIRAFGFNFAPIGWSLCNGQLVAISENTALYSIIGTTYGGDGQSTFGLPNLQGRVPMHWGTSQGFTTVIGEVQGTPEVNLTVGATPAHTHTMSIGSVPTGGVILRTPTATASTYIATVTPNRAYLNPPTAFNAQFSSSVISSVGGSLPHENMQPYLAVSFCICLQGIYPSRN